MGILFIVIQAHEWHQWRAAEMVQKSLCYNPENMILLASNSPRRKELLSLTGWDFRVITVDVDEGQKDGETPLQYVRRVAADKASRITNAKRDDLVITADTIVINGNEILGKPVSQADAAQILRLLRGREHQVVTSFMLNQSGKKRVEVDECCSQVRMRSYSEEEIAAYVASGDPMDKAGAYAVQNRIFHPVTDFRGCFANVMGLPLCHLARTLKKFGIIPMKNIPAACQAYLQYHCHIHAQILSGMNLG
jgi:MAF protein